MLDFTLTTFKDLLSALRNQGFSFQTFSEFLNASLEKAIILRNDVDKLPFNSLEVARIQAESGIKGTYYFRTVSESWNEGIIRQIKDMGHEVGYHYEDLGAMAQRYRPPSPRLRRSKGTMAEEELVRIAIGSFAENLEKLRKIVPVKTICMHGSPMSKWDSRLLWKYYDYHDFDLIGEPYFDINFDEVLYLSDTGRRWDGDSVNIRDKEFNLKGRKGNTTDTKLKQQGTTNQHPSTFPKFHSTFDIIKAAEQGELPNKIMMTFHPQRWTGKQVPWAKELVWQNIKNGIKYFVIKLSH